MTTQDGTEKKPLWLLIEEKILELGTQAFEGQNLEGTIRQVATDLDGTGYNVSNHGGNLLKLRWAVKEMLHVGRPFMNDFNEALSGLTLEDVTDPGRATGNLIAGVGETWASLKGSERKPDVLEIVEQTRLDLLTTKAKELGGDAGIRLLIVEGYSSDVVTATLAIDAAKFDEVNAAVEAEKAERERVKGLLEEVADKPEEDRIKHLIQSGVTDELITEIAGVGKEVLAKVNKAMEEEMAEKKRLEEEEAARKAAEAAGPALDDIPDDEMLDYIESIREILEFSDQETEIRAMCDQSSIPKSLVDLAVSDADKLDELEEKAGG